VLSSPKTRPHRLLGQQYRRSFPEGGGGSGGVVKLTPYIHLVPRLRMSGAMFHPYALMAWAGTSPMTMMMMMMMIIEEMWILFSRSFLFGNVTIYHVSG